MPTAKVSFLGDSITAAAGGWADVFCNQYYYGWVTKANHAVPGQSIMGHMDAQTLAAAGDDADLIIIALGANDVDGGDMAALQTKVETNIAALKVSNPRARIFYSNVLRCWTDASGVTEQPKDNIRNAISAACVAQNITCWDTRDWRVVTDTTDGVHNNASGITKESAQVLARV